jgi:MFS family permease
LLSMLGPGGEGDVGLWMGRITAAFLIGAALGGVAFGWLGDRVGRVRAMSLSILCYSLFSGAAFLAVEPWHLGVFRFIAALGMGGEWALGVAGWRDRGGGQFGHGFGGGSGADLAGHDGFVALDVSDWRFPCPADIFDSAFCP